ncbi:MAG: septum site-determining protein MinC [Gammaproteobacteria bacterium]
MVQAMEQEKQIHAFQLKGSLFPLTILQLTEADPLRFAEQLSHLVAQAPKFFQQAPIVIDISAFEESEVTINFQLYRDLLLKQGLVPVGITGGNESHQKQAAQLQMAILSKQKFNESSQSEESAPQQNRTTQTAPAAVATPNNRVITRPVRSGQQVYAKGGDLIVLSSVSHGAELLADGNIHIYGELRGRALAGINGDETARIFCRKLDAELIAIAGRFCLNEQMQNYVDKRHLQIYLENDHITIDEL